MTLRLHSCWYCGHRSRQLKWMRGDGYWQCRDSQACYDRWFGRGQVTAQPIRRLNA